MKIGQFEGGEFLYQDEVHGALLIMADMIKNLELRIKSQMLLEQTVCLVETAIEQGENVAL